MQHTGLILILALVASIHARDDWSWGPDSDDSASPSSRPSESVSGRSLTFPTSSKNEDHKLESSIQSEVIQPFQGSPASQSSRGPRVIQADQVFHSAQSLTAAPVNQAFHNTQTAQGFQSAPVTQAVHSAPSIPTSIAPQVVGANLKGEDRNSNHPGDGKAEGRFLGIKEKLCGVGIGFDCKKGYDSHGHGYGHGHHGGSGLSVYDVSYVQPIQVVPVGGPIAAVPVKKGHHKGHHSPPAYHPPKAPVSGYGAPRPTYSAPSHSYGAPAPVYNPPKATYGPPASSYASSSFASYTPPKSSFVKGAPSIVKHQHTHHHVYNGPSSHGGGGGYAFGKDNSFSSSSSGSSSHFNTFNSVKKVGNALPVIPPRKGFLTSNTQHSAYLEDCQCVERHYCSSFDIVGRSNRALPLLDARTRTTDILSTADDNTIETNSDSDDSLVFSASETETVVEAKENVHNADRKRRDVLSIVVKDTGFETAENLPDVQARQFKFSGYKPGLSGCAASHVCCRTPVFRSPRDAGSCGLRSSVGLLGRVKTTRFEKGDTEFAEYPWQAAILRKEGNDNVYVCGAVLIDAQHLLTAAHCINGINPTELKIRLGEWDVGSETEFYNYIESPVSGVYSHPEFYSGNLNNDIAVLRLFSPVDLITNPHVSPVCLPDRFTDFTGQRCHVTGWGKDAFGTVGDFQHLLKEVELPMVSHSRCESALRRTRLGPQFQLHEGMSCAGGEEGKDACEGDGGSPLVCRDRDGRMLLSGLVSWGVGCGTRGVPGVYVNIPHYLSWINSITRV